MTLSKVFYLAVPPSVFVESAKSIREHSWSKDGWNRVVIEKPFGKDYASAKQLSEELKKLFAEDEMYRIDHYLGKGIQRSMFLFTS